VLLNDKIATVRPVSVPGHRTFLIVSFVLGAVAMLLSVTGSWIPSLWGDEAASQLSARRSLPSLVRMVQHVDAVHGTYYAFLHFWVRLFGYGAFSIRFPSAIAVGLCVALVVWTCGRISTMRIGVLAGIACAVLPRLTYAGGEARPFSFDAAFAAALFAIVVEIVLRTGRSRRLWLAYGAVLGLATYFFLYNGLLALAIGAFILVTPSLRHHWRMWLLASGCALGVSLPVLVMAFLERAQISYLQSADYASWDVIFKQMWFGDTRFAWLGWIVMAIAVAAFVSHLAQIRGRALEPDIAVLALCWLVVPMALLLLANAFFPLFTARYAAFTAPAAGILIAFGIDAIARLIGGLVGLLQGSRTVTAIAAVLVVAVVAVAAPDWAAQRGPYAQNQSDWNQIATTVRAHSGSGDAVVFDGGARPSRRTRLAYDTAPPGSFGPVRDVLLKTSASENYTWYASTYSVRQAATMGRFDGVRRVWVVEYSTPSGLSGPHRPDTYGITELQQLGYHETASYPLHASVVYLFSERS
jgi:mannosyltransferase